MNAQITAISYSVPSGKLTHSELCERFGSSIMDKIAANSGILERRISDKHICTSDLAVNAAENLFKNFKIRKSDIDLIIFATQTPDYLMPTTACIIQERLGLNKNLASFDINLGCTQYTYALCVANAWIKSGMAQHALVLAGDTPSKIIHPKDKSALTLFGDGAVATLLEKSDSKGIMDFVFGTDGKGYKDLILPTSGFRSPPTPEDALEKEDDNGNIRTNNNMFIDGFKVFTFAYKVLYESVTELLSKNNMSVDDVDMFIFHQASEKIIRASAERLKIPHSKLHYKMHDIGNTGGSSVGIALADAWLSNRIKPGMKIVLASFGVGLSWNSILLEWSDSFLGAFTDADFSDSPKRPQNQQF